MEGWAPLLYSTTAILLAGGEDNWWGATENCIVVHEVLNNSSDSAAPTAIGGGDLDQDGSFNISLPRCYPNENITVNCTTKESSTLQFWEIYVLNLTKPRLGEPGDLGGFDYKIPLALFFSWTVVFLCLMKGVKSSGKVSSIKIYPLKGLFNNHYISIS